MGIFFLVLFYCVVVFIQIALPPPCEHVKSQSPVLDVVLDGIEPVCPSGMKMDSFHSDGSTEYCGTCRLSSSWPVVSQWLDVLRFFDVGILSIFVLEIILKTFAFRREFFADMWNVVDCAVVFASVAFVMTELLMPEDDFSSIFSVRLILRLLRVFVAGRRLTTTSRVLSRMKNQQKVNMEVPSETLIEMLKRFEVNHRLPKSDRVLCKELREIVANKTLYEAVVTAKEGEENAAAAWIHESSSMMMEHTGSTRTLSKSKSKLSEYQTSAKSKSSIFSFISGATRSLRDSDSSDDDEILRQNTNANSQFGGPNFAMRIALSCF